MCLSTSGNYTHVEILTGNANLHAFMKTVSFEMDSKISHLFAFLFPTCLVVFTIVFYIWGYPVQLTFPLIAKILI